MALVFTGKIGDIKVAMVDDEVAGAPTGPGDMVGAARVCIEERVGYAFVLLTGRGEGEVIDGVCLDVDWIFR